MNAPIEPKLAPPGAGLPKLELLIARVLFGVFRRRKTRDQLDADFQSERDRLLAIVDSCDRGAVSTRVLIPRLRGLEDSSRFWSVWMTLDHLRITNTVFGRVIHSLAQGNVPARKASTADVKPSPDVDATVVDGFQRACELFLKSAAAVPDLRTGKRFAHPWFGLLGAAGWHAIGAWHMALHRRQAERILAELETA